MRCCALYFTHRLQACMTTSLLSTATGDFRIDLQGPADAPMLVLSNSLGTTLEMWDAQAAALRSEFRVLRYDTRGHGASVCNDGPYSFDQLGRDVLAILDALQVQQAHFCGISMGGLTGLWLGVNAGQRLRSLTVANSAARIGVESAWLERAAQVRASGAAGMQALAESSPGRWFTPGFAAAQPAVVQRAQGWIAGIAPEGYASCCEALAREDLRAAIAAIATPTLLLAGAHDPVTTVADAQAMQAAIAGSQLVELQASHLSNLEAPQAFEQALAGFARQH
ncbi:3-oxoadipate enol-lactonase [Comamonas testosteroni KF-1]|jgi:3-oxoadipate enol-lactonase|uniref:3-oxoadipate enol-lactonase n=2 Tax=Comamonas testosteroni TaxID=285 RepID=B7WV61_COMTK|nr:3-oxoadipate enol-lactonase [Comamonas testosteroni KF-1]